MAAARAKKVPTKKIPTRSTTRTDATGKGAAKQTKRRQKAATKKAGRTRPERRAKKKAERTVAKKATNKRKTVAKKSADQGAARQTKKTGGERIREREIERKTPASRKVQRRKAIHEHKDANLRAAAARAKSRKSPTKGTLTSAALDAAGALGQASGAVHLSTWFPAIGLDVYNAFLDAEEHTVMTGELAQIRPKVGARFTTGEGRVWGRNLELVPGQRIVQEWETDDWPMDLPPSRVTLTFIERDVGTEMHIDHEGIPRGDVERFAEDWQTHYIEPMELYFATR